MTTEYNYIRDKHYLHVKVTGRYYFSGITAILKEIKSRCSVNNICNVLFDFKSVEGSIPFSEKYKIGEFVAEIFAGNIRLAVVDKPDNIDKLGENVAVNRGANIAVFNSIDQAIEWLTSVMKK